MITDALSLSADDAAEIVQELHIAKTDTYLQARCVPFRDRPGRLLGVVTVVNDITSLKMMDKLKSNFVHMVSHEIRSPLNSVLMQIKVVTDGLAGELTGKQTHIMNRVTERVKGLVNLSTELLDLSKIESGSVYTEKEEVDISVLLKEEVEFAAPKAHEKSLELFLAPLGPLPMMRINRLGMEEVVSNLVNNAIKYTPEGGRIDLSAQSDGKLLTIQVKDTGIGIPAADLDSIFNRFFRVKNKTTRFIVGTGLGLSIVKSIVEAHSGSIKVESKEGRGSTFIVELPL
jgi:signal transduction histidine kinase